MLTTMRPPGAATACPPTTGGPEYTTPGGNSAVFPAGMLRGFSTMLDAPPAGKGNPGGAWKSEPPGGTDSSTSVAPSISGEASSCCAAAAGAGPPSAASGATSPPAAAGASSTPCTAGPAPSSTASGAGAPPSAGAAAGSEGAPAAASLLMTPAASAAAALPASAALSSSADVSALALVLPMTVRLQDPMSPRCTSSPLSPPPIMTAAASAVSTRSAAHVPARRAMCPRDEPPLSRTEETNPTGGGMGSMVG
mmetsp:Transcript_10306/g.26710  ORF Transcript_10306/g.26710 Transcript_10306/m.26710 type:complete len:252 (-) Transcript_10306:8-763(-)